MTFLLCTLCLFLGYTVSWLQGLSRIGLYFAKIGVILEMETLKLAKEIDDRVMVRLGDLRERCLMRGDSKEVLKLYENEDSSDINEWRKRVMEIISEHFPEHVRREFAHRTWEEAMNNVNAYYLLIEAKRLQEKDDSREHDGDEV